MTPISAISPLTRLRLRALGLYVVATVALVVIPYVAIQVSDALAFLLILIFGVAMGFAFVHLNPPLGDLRWMIANWRSFGGRLAVYFTSIGIGTTLLFGDHHPLVRACGAVALAGGAAFEWLRIEPPQAASPEAA